MAYSKIGKALADIARKKGQATTMAKKQKFKERFNSEDALVERIAKKKYLKAEKKANTSRPKKEGTKEERAEKAAELRELREQRADNIKELRFKVGGAVKKCKRDGIAVRGRTKGRMV